MTIMIGEAKGCDVTMGEVGAMGTRVCPQCGQVLFADMDVCYGCLHRFARENERSAPTMPAQSVGHVPEHLPESLRQVWEERAYGDMDEPPGLVVGQGGGATDVSPPAPPDKGAVLRSDEPMEEGYTSRPQGSFDTEVTTILSLVPPVARVPALCVRTSVVDVVVPLPAGGLSIGRAPDNDVVLHSMAVSRHHLRMEPTSGGATAFDLGATNPAQFRGHPVPSEQELSTGDVLDVCGTLLSLVDSDLP